MTLNHAQIVSTDQIISMLIPLLFSIGLVAFLIVFNRKRTGIAVKPLLIGAVGFIVFTQILEKILHVIVLTKFPNLMEQPWLFGIYGGMAAGVFEEIGRFILYTWFLKKYLDYRGGLSFGIGWGGTEAILIMAMVMLPNILFAMMINAGTFESTLGEVIPADQLTDIRATIVNQGIGYYLLASIERSFALILQIALSLLVLFAVVRKKFSYVVFAILIHALVDLPAAFYQTGNLQLWVVELYVGVVALLSLIFIFKIRKNWQAS